MNTLEILFAELGKQIGIESLAFDEEGSCTLAFDEDLVVTFLAANDDLYAVCYVADLPEDKHKAIDLLNANFAWKGTQGATYAIEPGSNRVVLCRQWDASSLQIGQLVNDLEALVNVAEAEKANLSNIEQQLDAQSFSSSSLDQRV